MHRLEFPMSRLGGRGGVGKGEEMEVKVRFKLHNRLHRHRRGLYEYFLAFLKFSIL